MNLGQGLIGSLATSLGNKSAALKLEQGGLPVKELQSQGQLRDGIAPLSSRFERSDFRLPRIVIDGSHTFSSGKNTGIERVVRNLCQHLPEVLSARGFGPLKTTVHFRGRFLEMDPALQVSLRRLSEWERNASEFVPGWIQGVPRWFAGRTGSRKLRKWLDPQPSHLGIYKAPHHLARWSTLWKGFIWGGSISPGSDQILILPDAYWTRRDIWRTVQRHRDAGTMIATVVYDMIPLTHPQYVGRKRSQKFRTYLDQVIRHSDTIIAISKSVRDEVRNYIESQPQSDRLCRDVRSFVLGAELSVQSSGNKESEVRPIVQSLFDKQHEHAPYLMVASFDPRKNHAQALDAFDLLWKSHPELNLCFAGRSGSMCSELMERIETHPKLHRGLWVFHDLSDAELHYAYARCQGVLLPSIVEGFGLPIVESIWHGRKTFASDTPIHREVGGQHCEYFALHDALDLARRIEAWEAAGKTRGLSLQRYVPTTWQQSSVQLFDEVLEAYLSRFAPAARRAA